MGILSQSKIHLQTFNSVAFVLFYVLKFMASFSNILVLVVFNLRIVPQVGGLSALQKSRVGSLLPILTHTVAQEMI